MIDELIIEEPLASLKREVSREHWLSRSLGVATCLRELGVSKEDSQRMPGAKARQAEVPSAFASVVSGTSLW